MWTYNYNDELYHFGIKGMKWGVRRYQNEDGTLTDAGEKRYARDAREKEYDKYDDKSKTYYKQSKKNGKQELRADANRYVTEDMRRTKTLFDESSRLVSTTKNVHSEKIKKANEKHRENNQRDLSAKSDQELREAINRKMLERQYNDLFNPRKASKGEKYISNALDAMGNVMAFGSSALGIMLAIKQLRG